MRVFEGNFRGLRVWSESHARPYDFTPYESLGKEFVGEVANCFWLKCETEYSAATGSTYWCGISRLLGYLLALPENLPLRQALSTDYTTARKKDWQSALGAYRSEIAENPDKGSRTKDNSVSRVRPILKHLADKGVVPQMGDVIRGFDFDSSPKRSLAQITNGALSEAELKVRIAKVRLSVEKTEIPGALSYFNALASESELDADIPIPEQVLILLDRRLSTLRSCAEKDLLDQYTQFKRGQALIGVCDLSVIEISRRIDRVSGGPALVNDVFPSSERGLARLLAYYRDAHQGCRPGYGFVQDERELGKELSCVEMEFGGAESVRQLLGHGRRLLTCVSVIAMVDQALNAESARGLSRDCLGPVESGMRRFSWTKRRASKKKDSFSELVPVKDGVHDVSLVRAVEMALECTDALAKKAATEGDRFKSNLLLSNVGTTTNSYTGESVRLSAQITFLKQLKAFAGDHEELAGIADSMTQDQIRPSVLLHEALRTRSVLAVQQKAKHKSTKTSFIYVHRLPTQIAGNANIQQFMQHFQVLAAKDVDGVIEKAGIPKDRFDSLRAELVDVGLGVFCEDPMAGEQADLGYGEGDMCGAFEKCIECPKRADYIFATPENISNLFQWQVHLEEQREIRMRENPQRWLNAWEPWCVFVEVALEKLGARQYAKLLREGKNLAEASSTIYPELT